MHFWWYFVLIGSISIGIIYCDDDDANPVASDDDNETPQDVVIGLRINDGAEEPIANVTHTPSANEGLVTEVNVITNPTPEPFACHECTNCHSKSDTNIRACEPGITMCYVMHKRVNKTNRLLRRGCSTSKGQCTVPDNDQPNSFDTITCCTSHKCNQAAQFKLSFILSLLSLFIIFISFSHA